MYQARIINNMDDAVAYDNNNGDTSDPGMYNL